MKRFISILLVLALVLTVSVSSFAATPEIDLTSLSDDELLELKISIDKELDNRGKGGIIVSNAILNCPEDIDPGTYKVTLLDDTYLAYFAIQKQNGGTDSLTMLEQGESGQFNIREDLVLKLNGKFVISKPEKISFN